MNIFCSLDGKWNVKGKPIDIDDLMRKYPKMRYLDALEIMDRYKTADIRDRDIVGMVRRYFYCQRWHTAPFEGGYDKQPKEWRDTADQIDRCRTSMNEFNAAKGTHGNGNIRQANTHTRARRAANTR